MLRVLMAAMSLALAPPLPGFVPVGVGPAGGVLLQGTIQPSTRQSLVYLPPGYTRARSYPVVYLLHGMPGSPSGFAHSLQLAQVGDSLGTPFIAVAPVAGPTSKYRGEWAGPWEDYLIKDVVPWVDANLSIGPRTIAGLSAGGYGAVDIALRHPGLFGTIESWSGYFTPFRDGPLARATPAQLAAHDPELLVRRQAPFLRPATRFFLSAGPTHGDVLQSATSAFGAELTRLRIAHVTWLLRTTKADWRAQLKAGLRYAFGPATS
jgi:enterochelin esterase-like enzyme